MADWEKRIQEADDDYLTGLSNKGTVKRAYKDLDGENPRMEQKDGEIVVKLKEETCTIRMPLGESSCTCPSRSICRHIVTSVLWLRRELAAAEKAEKEPSSETGENTPDAPSEPGEGTENKPDAFPPPKEKEEKSARSRFQEFSQMPADRLRKLCGPSRFRKFLAHVRAEGLPPVEATSIVTVEIPWEQVTVKLLEPLKHSSCTCKSRELCAHKAEALLVWQLLSGICTLPELDGMQKAEERLDRDQVRETCRSVKAALEEQFGTGLSRQSPDVSESLERLAVISHRAGLADMERLLREAALDYQQYFHRLSVFREEELMDRLLNIYFLAERMEEEEDPERLQSMAGRFRDTYEPAGRLHLMGMGARSFAGGSGYDGEIFYFLDLEKRRFLTWTDARPTFYEGNQKRAQAAVKNGPAPWGLNVGRQQLPELEIELRDAKLAFGGRLSASQETRGEILGPKTLRPEAVRGMIVRNYERLVELCFSEKEERKEHLALLEAARWDETFFDRVKQRFSWKIYDREGRSLSISLQYTKEEELTIRLLERLEKRLRGKDSGGIIFFGAVYVKDGELCLFPIEFDTGKEKSAKDEPEDEREQPLADESGDKGALAAKETMQTMDQYLREVVRELSDLFVTGLSSCREEMAGRILFYAKEGEALGLHRAGQALDRIGKLLESRRHRMDFSPGDVLKSWKNLNRYLRACREKVSRDQVLLALKTKEEEDNEFER